MFRIPSSSAFKETQILRTPLSAFGSSGGWDCKREKQVELQEKGPSDPEKPKLRREDEEGGHA